MLITRPSFSSYEMGTSETASSDDVSVVLSLIYSSTPIAVRWIALQVTIVLLNFNIEIPSLLKI